MQFLGIRVPRLIVVTLLGLLIWADIICGTVAALRYTPWSLVASGVIAVILVFIMGKFMMGGE